ncbi:MAG: aconitate hydratase [Spirochaetia bacterium]|jgi:aconitate hydratase
MKDTITGMLIGEHLVEGTPAAGKEIGLRIDQTLTQDATGTMAYLEFESMGLPRVKAELAVSYIDHNIIQTDFKNADDHRFLISCASKYGVILSPPGNGVSHHVHRQRFGAPGKTLLGSDSHTTTGGCLGMLAIGAGGNEVAMAMAGKPFYLMTPKVWGIHVEGLLRPWVSGKDVILELLRRFSAKAGTGKIMEFFGPGVAKLDMAARGTIANMAVDMGFTACVFPSDEVTRWYLGMNGRENDFRPLTQGADPRFDEVTRIDLSAIEPLVACPSNPDNVKTAAELSNVEVQQVLVGSSTNGSYRDLMIVARALEGRQRHPTVDLSVNPGSRQTLENVMAMGGIKLLVDAGARICEAGCLGCIGMGQAPASGTNSLRTMPRNYKGRSGTDDDFVYLCSPETAAASALTGRITDPRTLGDFPSVDYPTRYAFNPNWFFMPARSPDDVQIIRGPNIKPFPTFGPLEDSIEAEVLIKVGNDISTDIIMPAGNRVLPFRSNIPAISDFVFIQADQEFARRAREKKSGAVIGGENYGQGSSREHAALAPRYLGVRLKIAKSFARIHKSNLINFGILPLTFGDPSDYEAIHQGDKVRITGVRKLLESGATDVPVQVNGKTIMTKLDVSDRHRRILLAGGLLNLARAS